MTSRATSSICPRCFTALAPEVAERCPSCELVFVRSGGLLDVLGPRERESRAAEVEAFYTHSPFPGYAPGDDGPALLDRCRRTPFMVSLDAAIPIDARVLDAGCGTAQIPAFLALAAPGRSVFGVDGCKASLAHAEEFRARAGIDNLQLVRADLFELPLAEQSFAFVISRGVVHHTPDPERAIGEVARRVAPGGVLVLGFYETWARGFHCARRALSRSGSRPIVALDPVLRRRDLDSEKKRIWIEDQYRHPLEHILPLPRVLAVLRQLGFHWVRTIPPHAAGQSAFDATPEPGSLGLFARRLGWLLRGIRDPDAGLVLVIARRART